MSSLLVFFASGIFEVKLSPKKLEKKKKIEGGWGYVKRECIRSYVHELFKEKFAMKDYAPNLGEGEWRVGGGQQGGKKH